MKIVPYLTTAFTNCGKEKIHDVTYCSHHGCKLLLLQENYRRPLPTNQRISPTTNTTNKIPIHTPALKISPTTSQDDKLIAIANAKSPNKE